MCISLLNKLAPFLYYEGLPGCWEWSSLTTNIQWHVWYVHIIRISFCFVIDRYCRVPSLSIEGAWDVTSASPSDSSKTQVFSCFLRLPSYSHTAMTWTGRKLLYLTSTPVKHWKVVPQNHRACSRLYCLLYYHFWSVNSSIWPLLALTMASHYLLVGLALTLGSQVRADLQIYALM